MNCLLCTTQVRTPALVPLACATMVACIGARQREAIARAQAKRTEVTAAYAALVTTAGAGTRAGEEKGARVDIDAGTLGSRPARVKTPP